MLSRILSTSILFFFLPSAVIFAQQWMGQPVELFDGHSLNGWVKANGQPVDSGWAVENGTLTRASRGGDIFTQTEFENFTLSFEWKIASGGNSGVKYRVRKYGNAWLGCEYQVLDDKKQPYTKHSSGSLYDVFAPSQNKVPLSPETWNAALIVVNGNRITHWLNGQKLIDVDTDSDQWLQAINSSKFRSRDGFGTNARGKIMLQDHGHQVWFKNIILTPIESVETVKPSVISYQISKSGGCGCQFNNHFFSMEVYKSGCCSPHLDRSCRKRRWFR